MAGIRPASDAVSVNVGVAVAGYVIDLRERDERGGPLPKVTIDGAGAVVVDAKPEPVRGIGGIDASRIKCASFLAERQEA